jgi:hypothetical protein
MRFVSKLAPRLQSQSGSTIIGCWTARDLVARRVFREMNT